MLYHLYEMQRASMMPARLMAEAIIRSLRNPMNPLGHTPAGRITASALEVFEHATRRYGKPDWELPTTMVDDVEVAVTPEVILSKDFCDLVHFKRDIPDSMDRKDDPKLLIVAPWSGHFATLLRGTVEAMLPDQEVYITDWADARMVPMTAGTFDLDDYIDYLLEFMHFLGPNTHVLAVCQPAVPVTAMTALLGAMDSPVAPPTITVIGGPIDTREGETDVNRMAQTKDLDWYERNVVVRVPAPYPGMMRKVYPGFVQLTNFMSMNLDRHVSAHMDLFEHLVTGDEDSAENRMAFYEEYRAVQDLTAEFYLQTVDIVFQRHLLPRGEWYSRWRHIDTSKIKKTAILAVEGELDDISGVGQTRAIFDMTPNLPDDMKHYHLQEGAGHYGVFNGSRWRKIIAPRIKDFIRQYDYKLGQKPRLVKSA